MRIGLTMESVPDPKIHTKGKINYWYRYYRYFNAQVYADHTYTCALNNIAILGL